MEAFQFGDILKKENHPDEAYVKRGQRKALYRRERDSLEGPHEEAEIQRKALRRGKNLAFSEHTCLEKERLRSTMTPRKVEVRLKRRRELSMRRSARDLCVLYTHLVLGACFDRLLDEYSWTIFFNRKM